jgi:GntR family transcriptional regulator
VPGLNPSSPLPLYHQLADVLMGRIRSGEYLTGQRIPSEPALARTFGIGRPTVRQATGLLIRRRCLERRRGSGTYVVEPPPQVDLFSLAGTLTSFEKKGIAARSTVLERTRRIEVSGDPENPFSGREACFFARLTRVAGEPVLLEEIYLDPERFAGIERISLAGRSLAEVVDEHFHVQPESADQDFRIVSIDPERAQTLGTATGDPILLVKRRLHFPGSDNAIFAELYTRTDRLVFSQTLVAPPEVTTHATPDATPGEALHV